MIVKVNRRCDYINYEFTIDAQFSFVKKSFNSKLITRNHWEDLLEALKNNTNLELSDNIDDFGTNIKIENGELVFLEEIIGDYKEDDRTIISIKYEEAIIFLQKIIENLCELEQI